jgi:hypothetical protein
MSWLGCRECVGIDVEQISGIDGSVIVVVQSLEGRLNEAMAFGVVHGGLRLREVSNWVDGGEGGMMDGEWGR